MSLIECLLKPDLACGWQSQEQLDRANRERESAKKVTEERIKSKAAISRLETLATEKTQTIEQLKAATFQLQDARAEDAKLIEQLKTTNAVQEELAVKHRQRHQHLSTLLRDNGTLCNQYHAEGSNDCSRPLLRSCSVQCRS